jgi:hypothetical protein
MSCGNASKEQPSQTIVTESEVSAALDEKYGSITPDLFPNLEALFPEVELTDGKAYLRFESDTARYRLIPDSVYSLDGARALLLLRCIRGDEPCSHADAAYFLLVKYNQEGGSFKVLQESPLLPVYSPWCDKLEPRIHSIKGVPHLLFEMSDSHQESWREYYWMISAGEQNFGALVWEEEIYTKGMTEGNMDKTGVFPVKQMEAEVEFDTTHCDEGVWVMNISKTTTESLSNATEGEPSPESQKLVDNFKPVVKEEQLKKVYRMSRNGRLVRSR